MASVSLCLNWDFLELVCVLMAAVSLCLNWDFLSSCTAICATSGAFKFLFNVHSLRTWFCLTFGTVIITVLPWMVLTVCIALLLNCIVILLALVSLFFCPRHLVDCILTTSTRIFVCLCFNLLISLTRLWNIFFILFWNTFKSLFPKHSYLNLRLNFRIWYISACFRGTWYHFHIYFIISLWGFSCLQRLLFALFLHKILLVLFLVSWFFMCTSSRLWGSSPQWRGALAGWSLCVFLWCWPLCFRVPLQRKQS